LRIPGPTSAGAPRAAPDLAADAPDVPWTEDARRVLSRVEEEAEAAGDSYLGTHHLLLAAVATPPGATGVPGLNPAAVRAAVAAVVKAPRPAAEVAGTTRWPTPRLRRAITQAAMRALVNGRPLERRDLWHALLTDAGSDVCPILKRLGLDPEQLLELLA
jgi:ATP-dependent Clp protease ATP-binding subunit ClpA